MPFNKLHVPKDLPVEKCHAINDELHNCLVDVGGVDPDDNFCVITRYSAEDMLFHPTFLGERDPAATIVIEIVWLAGRSDEQKEDLFREIRRRLSQIGFDPANSIVSLTENNAIDWSFSEAGSVKSVLGL